MFVETKQIATFNKNALLSKINANMLIRCDENINKIQVDEVQMYKLRPETFDMKKGNYASLVQINFPQFNDVGIKDGKLDRIEFTNPENAILSIIEDVNDNLNKENQKKSARNAINIAFFDVSKMSKVT